VKNKLLKRSLIDYLAYFYFYSGEELQAGIKCILEFFEEYGA